MRLLHDLLELADDRLQVVRREVGIELGFDLVLALVERLVEQLHRDAEGDFAEHLDEAAVAIVREPRIAGLGHQALDRLVVEAEVEDGVHHARHGELRAGAHAQQQRIGGVAQLLAGQAFELLQRFPDLRRRLRPGTFLSLSKKMLQTSVMMVNPGGTGTPARLISARPEPLPPSVSFIVPSPSAVPPPNM